jgi:hypothetical protein
VSLSYETPTVVIGPRGYGSILSEKNIYEHVKWNFQGRIGGEIGEEIPYWILFDDFESFEKRKKEIKESTKSIANRVRTRFDHVKIFTKIQNELLNLKRLDKKIKSNNGLLKPKLCKDIKVMGSPEEGIFYLLRGNSFIVGTISDYEKQIIKKCNGDTSLTIIRKATNIPGKEITEFVTELWRNKIIYF